MKTRRALLGCIFALWPALGAVAQERSITVRFHDIDRAIRLFSHILPAFTARTGIQVRVVALGTGQALDVGRRGDADVVFVHDRTAEDAFVAEGFAARRYDVMYNDFVVVGPKSDPARAAGRDVAEALRRIAAAEAPFISRGDRSGTHAAEVRFWREAGADPGKSEWYKEIGQGMGPALNVASASNAYLLTDRGTWLSFRNRGELTVLVEGDRRLFNPYGVMLVNPARHPHVKAAEGQRFIEWLLSTEGQGAIASFRIDGEPLFFPNAGGPVRS